MIKCRESRDERTHAVPEQNYAQRRIFRLYCRTYRENILDHDAPAVLGCDEAEFIISAHGLAVTEMVVRDADETVFRDESHEIIISLDMLGHAVTYLENAFFLSIGNIYLHIERMNLILPKEKRKRYGSFPAW